MAKEISFLQHRMSIKGIVYKTSKRIKTYRKRCVNLGNFFDIGANVGVFSHMAARLLDVKNIYSFEPVRSNFRFLQKNINRNRRLVRNKFSCKIHAFNYGLWSSKKVMSLGFPKDRFDFDNTGLYTIWSDKNAVQCEFTTLDDWCEENNIYPDFIKIDAEGSEKEILLGAKNAMSHARFIVYECNNNYLEHIEGIADMLRDMGFEYDKKISKRYDPFWRKA